VLVNPRCAGLRGMSSSSRSARAVGPVMPGGWTPIVDECTWRAAIDVLTTPGHQKHPKRRLLTGTAFCGVCGQPVHSGGIGGRDGRSSYSNYQCRSARHIARRVDHVDEYVVDRVIARLQKMAPVNAGRHEKRVIELTEEAAELRRERPGTVGQALAEVEEKMAEVGHRKVMDGLISALADAVDIRIAWNAIGTDRQRAVISELAVIHLDPPGRGTRVFRPETVRIEWRRRR